MRSCGHAVLSERSGDPDRKVVTVVRSVVIVLGRVNGVLNIFIFFEFTYGVGFYIHRKVHAGLDDAYDHLVFAAHAYELAAEAGEAANGHLHQVALGVKVGADLHLGAIAQFPLWAGDGGRARL